MTHRSHPLQRLLAALATLLCTAVTAAPVAFQVTPTAFGAGAGYGSDGSELGGTLLDVGFSASGNTSSFSLEQPLETFTFAVGPITLLEQGTIDAAETDGLAVQAVFAFTDPTIGNVIVSGLGVATVGTLGDADVDYRIDWTGANVAFGNGGLFNLTLSSTLFRDAGASQLQTATLTLIVAPTPARVPEPHGAALAALALAGLAALRSRGR
jgi:hypothetical protein